MNAYTYWPYSTSQVFYAESSPWEALELEYSRGALPYDWDSRFDVFTASAAQYVVQDVANTIAAHQAMQEFVGLLGATTYRGWVTCFDLDYMVQAQHPTHGRDGPYSLMVPRLWQAGTPCKLVHSLDFEARFGSATPAAAYAIAHAYRTLRRSVGASTPEAVKTLRAVLQTGALPMYLGPPSLSGMRTFPASQLLLCPQRAVNLWSLQ